MDYTNIATPTGSVETPQIDADGSEREKIVPVVDTSNVTVKKAGVAKKLYNVFFSASPEEVASDLKRTVLIPAIKRGILDIITIGASMLINGKDSANQWNRSPYTFGNVMGTIIDYNGISTNRVTNTNLAIQNRPLGVLSLDTICFKSVADAEIVLYNMRKYLQQYTVVTAAEYYEFCGNYNYDWQAHHWGWDNLEGANVISSGGQYRIALPPVRPLSKK